MSSKEDISDEEEEEELKRVNILVMGQSGVGKTTWINSFINYLLYPNMQEAERQGLKIVLNTKFSLADDEYKTRIIEKKSMGANPPATDSCQSTILLHDNLLLELIDTPGIGGEGSLEDDRVTIKKILDHICMTAHIHAICVLLKPNEARIEALFRYCFIELLSYLHKNAIENIFFCFTYTRATFYKPGDTLPVLKKLTASTKLKLPLIKDHIYNFDNECFRYMCSKEAGIRYSKGNIEEFVKSWEVSSKEAKRFLNLVKEKRAHQVYDTITLNKSCLISNSLLQPTVAIIKVIAENIVESQRYIKETETSQSDINFSDITLKCIPIDHPRLVCANKNCVEYVTLRDTRVRDKVYKQICEEKCTAKITTFEVKGDEAIAKSKVMKNNKCTVCNCSYKDHIVIIYEKVKEERNIIDYQNETKEKTKEHLENIKKRLKELKAEVKEILKVTATISNFLKQNSITSYRDTYEEGLEELIKEEEERKENDPLIAELKATLDLYRERVEKEVTRKVVLVDVEKLKSTLFELEINGKQIKGSVDAYLQAKKTILASQKLKIN